MKAATCRSAPLAASCQRGTSSRSLVSAAGGASDAGNSRRRAQVTQCRQCSPGTELRVEDQSLGSIRCGRRTQDCCAPVGDLLARLVGNVDD